MTESPLESCAFEQSGLLKKNGFLQVELQKNGRDARLTRNFKIKCHKCLDKPIKVYEGFITDFASVPRLFWQFFPPWGPYSIATVVHDFHYEHKIITWKEADDNIITREKADDNIITREKADLIFLKLMIQLDVPKWKCFPMYWAVRMWGWIDWNKRNRKKSS